MAFMTRSSAFGAQGRTRVLLALRLLSESYPRQLAGVLAMPVSSVQKALQGLERDALVAGRSMGRTRLYKLDPRYFAYEELQRFLLRLSQPEIGLRNRVASLRRRPRRGARAA